MEGDAIEVRNDLIDRDGRSPARETSAVGLEQPCVCDIGGAYPENRSVRRDWIRTFW